MNLSRKFQFALLGLLVLHTAVRAEDGGVDDDAGDDAVEEENVDDAVEEENGDDAAVDEGDDAAQDEDDGNYNNNVANYHNYENGDDEIKYWAGYAVYPKKCVTYKGVDVIVFNVYENGFKQCSDTPMGTYVTPVPTFVEAYLDQLEANEQDMGNDDYELPEAAAYSQCAQYNGNNGQYSVMIGCTDDDPHSLSVNIYSDATCETRDYMNGMDDANIDVSDIQIPFHSCQACVTWLDKNDDEVDDQYYENKLINAPLCSQIWARKEDCDKSCQKLSKEYEDSQHWTKSDAILLSVLGAFAALMMVVIMQKRRQMRAQDDSLLASEVPMKSTEEPMISDKHLLIAFGVCVLLIVIFSLAVLKGLTWALLLGLNLALFGFLLKMVMDSGTACGYNDDDSDDEEEEELQEPQGQGTAGELT